MLVRKHFDNREDWLKARQHGIGASEMSAIVGVNNWLSITDLRDIKRGVLQAKDLSDNEFVQNGVAIEEPMRQLFLALHKDEFDLEYHPFDILSQKGREWQFATLDGELIRKSDKERGILEIKSSTPTKGKWSEWESGVPQYYYVQILSQFLATEYNFAYLFAALFAMNGSIILREYEFYREECKGDMEMLLSQATTFWNDCVIGNKFPTKQLVL